MTLFKEISSILAQSVCILTHDHFGIERSCTISSYGSVSASMGIDFFSFSLTQDSFMAGIVRHNSNVRITLLSQQQSSVAKFYVKNRYNSEGFSMDRVGAGALGIVAGRVDRTILVGGSILYLAEVQEIKLLRDNSRPLVYRLRNYE